MMVFSGNANPPLAQKIAAHLGMPLGKAIVGQFSDGEVMFEILEMFVDATSLSFNPPAHQPMTT